MTRKTDLDPVCCGVCWREARGLAYVGPSRRGEPPAFLWLCEDPTCIQLGKTVFQMSEKQLSAHEGLALHDAGQVGGEFLESIGKTDLGEMNAKEWHEFLKKILFAYADNMRARLLNHVAPF